MTKDIKEKASKLVNKEVIPDNNLIAFEKGFFMGLEWLLDNMWISVEDKLPPFEECVIVHYDNDDMVGEMFSTRTEDINVIKDNHDFCIYCGEKITHWMPIPKLNEMGTDKKPE